jgi:hypothetical protein
MRGLRIVTILADIASGCNITILLSLWPVPRKKYAHNSSSIGNFQLYIQEMSVFVHVNLKILLHTYEIFFSLVVWLQLCHPQILK